VCIFNYISKIVNVSGGKKNFRKKVSKWNCHHPAGGIVTTCVGALAGADAVCVAVSLRGARKELDDKSAPLAGLTAVFIFAVQMLNFPVGAGTSGHLLGGALAAVLVGPWAATLALTVVLIMQGFLFADGGLSAIGFNVFNIGVIGVWAGYGIYVIVKKVLPKRKTSVALAGAIGGLISVPLAAFGFVVQYALGGNATFSLASVFTAMIGTHIIIGIGEALITGLTISAIMASRSDLVHGWKSDETKLVIKEI
jgi:cobalamin biosynthesis protein CbiM